jgi:hypothetical protein
MPDNFALEWDKTGERLYETGTDRGVLYPQANDGSYPKGVAWNGLTGVTESPSGADKTDVYADNMKYLVLRSAEDFGATITAYTYPVEWEECDGSYALTAETISGIMSVSQQPRKTFGLSYRTLVGNDLLGNDYAYKLHLIYGCTTSPSERANSTVNESPAANEMSWEVSTTPLDPEITVSGKVLKPTAHIEIDVSQIAKLPSTDTHKLALLDKIAKIEQFLYGREGDTEADPVITEISPQLLLPKDIYGILTGANS